MKFLSRLSPNGWLTGTSRVRKVTVAIVICFFATASVATGINIFRQFRNHVGTVQSTTDDPTILSNGINDKFFDRHLGLNGQACSTCHEPDQSFGLSVNFMRQQFIRTVFEPELDEIFRDNDTADLPGADESDPIARVIKYRLALELGTTRIGRPLPPVKTDAACTDPPNTDPTQSRCRDFFVTLKGATAEPAHSDRFGDVPLSNDPQAAPGTKTLSLFRRPLVNTNVHFDSAVLWDGREDVHSLEPPFPQVTKAARTLLLQPNLSQADAQEISEFMLNVFTAQESLHGVGRLSSRGAKGGVQNLLALSKTYGPLICDPTKPHDPNDPTSCPIRLGDPAFNLFDSWANLPGTPANAGKRAVARGQKVFNDAILHRPPDLAALPPFANIGPAPGFEMRCTTCHAVPNVGNNPFAVFLGRLGTDSVPILTALRDSRPDLPSLAEFARRLKQLPEYCFRSVNGPPLSSVACGDFAGDPSATPPIPGDVLSTDPGRALNGKPGSASITLVGRFKPPVLRGLSGRPPYFHQGAAKDLDALIDFYDARFQIHLTPQQHADLKAFLEAL